MQQALGSGHAHPDPRLRSAEVSLERGGDVRIQIETAVGRVFGVCTSDLGRPTRGRKKVALARQAAMYLAHIACGLRLTEVGNLFSRDRSTVAHACEVIEDRRDDPVFDRVMQLLEWIIRALLTPRRNLTPS